MFFSVVVPSCVSPVARATTPSLPSLNVNFAQVGSPSMTSVLPLSSLLSSPSLSSLLQAANVIVGDAKLLQKSEMRKDIVIELSYKGFG